MGKTTVVKRLAGVMAAVGAVLATSAHAQQHNPGDDIKMTFVPLLENANAVIAEPPTTDPVRSHIAILIAHPEHINTFNYFLAPHFAIRGYRTMMLNYYGREETYEELLAPIAAAVRYLRQQPGIQRVVFAAHSSGGAELTFYQDVAENGQKACQGRERVYPCRGLKLDNLPKADAMMLLDINIGGPLRTIAIDPAVDNSNPRLRNQKLDMFDPRNGYDQKSHSGKYAAEFEHRYFAAQHVRNERLIEEASTRLAKIEKGDGDFKDDEPFTVAGGSVRVNGARLDLADRNLLSRTHAPHLFLKADGTTPTQIVPTALGGAATSDDLDRLYDTAQIGTIRHYLSFYGLRTTAEFALTTDDIRGILWRSSANSAPGNVEGITVPTLAMAGTCAAHLVPIEVAYDHSAAKDKQFVAIEGANHNLLPCKPEYGDTSKRAFDYADAWLTASGRL